MPAFAPWQIWWVRWVYPDTGEVEERPALLLAGLEYEPVTPNALPFAKITRTKVEGAPDMLDLIKGEDPEFEQTGLRETCYVYLRNVQEIDRTRGVLNYRGLLGPNTVALVIEILRAIQEG